MKRCYNCDRVVGGPYRYKPQLCCAECLFRGPGHTHWCDKRQPPPPTVLQLLKIKLRRTP
jgi:hypothetical protein